MRVLWHRVVMAPPLEAGLQGAVRHVFLRVGAGAAAPWVVGAVDCVLLAVGLWWILGRRRLLGTLAGIAENPLGRLAPAGVLALLPVVVPTPWGSEYVLALPRALLALQHRRGGPGVLIAGVLLTFLLPGVDIFLLRCHRLVGVALLLWATMLR